MDEKILDEQIFHKHYIRTDAKNRIIHGFSSAFESPQDGDILINENGGRHFELGGVANPPLRDNHGFLLYFWDGEKILRRTDAELAADRQAIEASPAAQIARLDREITAGLPQVVAQICSVVFANISPGKNEPVSVTNRFESAIPAISDEILRWRQLVAERDALERRKNNA